MIIFSKDKKLQNSSQKVISIIIPVFNEKNYIVTTLEKVTASNTLGFEKEIIVVDDGSTDDTVLRVKACIKRNKHHVQLITKKNEGKGSALKIGFLHSHGDIVLVQDADLEYNPDDYPSLITPFITHNADVVYGSRFISDKIHRILYFWHTVGNKLLTTFSNLMTNLNLTDMETGYKVFRGEIIRRIAPHLESKRFGFEPEITARIAKMKDIRIYEVGISYQGRTYNEGKKIGWRDGIRAIGEIIKYNLFSSVR